MTNAWIVVGVLSLSACSIIFQADDDDPACVLVPQVDDGVLIGYRPSNVNDFSLIADAPDCLIPAGVTWTVRDESIEVRRQNEEICSGPRVRSASLPGSRAATLLLCNNFEIQFGGLLVGVGVNPIIVLASGSIVIDGDIDVAGRGVKSGPGGGALDGTPTTLEEVGAGASGGSYGSEGGVGTLSEAGVVVSPTYGSPSLIPLSGGSVGGTTATFGRGGGGGGAIQLSAGQLLVVSGNINAGGGGGSAGGNMFAPDEPGKGGGGGGSGGSILLEAPEIRITGFLGASGGGGGASASTEVMSSRPGADAMNGREAKGGDSSPDSKQGGSGAFGPAEAMAGNRDNTDTSGGGGGGGFGRIRINTDGKGPDDFTNGLSPPSDHMAVTVGTLR